MYINLELFTMRFEKPENKTLEGYSQISDGWGQEQILNFQVGSNFGLHFLRDPSLYFNIQNLAITAAQSLLH